MPAAGLVCQEGHILSVVMVVCGTRLRIDITTGVSLKEIKILIIRVAITPAAAVANLIPAIQNGKIPDGKIQNGKNQDGRILDGKILNGKILDGKISLYH